MYLFLCGKVIALMRTLCKDISCAGEQNVTSLNSGASIAIMVNDPSSLVEMAHP